jgi:hypothetical protein
MFALSEMSCFYGFRNTRTFGILSQILSDTATELFKMHTARTLQEKLGQMGCLL